MEKKSSYKNIEIITNKLSDILDNFDFKKEQKSNELTEYEKAAGFTTITRCGARSYNMELANFFEKMPLAIIDGNYEWIGKKRDFSKCDGILTRNKNVFYIEFKSKYNTIKGSDIYNTLVERIDSIKKIDNNNFFYLAIIVDKKDVSRSEPLANYCNKLKDYKNYNPKKHRVISNIEVYKFLFGEYWKYIKEFILKEITKRTYSIKCE
jgi:hypothetical protein